RRLHPRDAGGEVTAMPQRPSRRLPGDAVATRVDELGHTQASTAHERGPEKPRAESRATTSAVLAFLGALVGSLFSLAGRRHGLGGADSLGAHAAAIGAVAA